MAEYRRPQALASLHPTQLNATTWPLQGVPCPFPGARGGQGAAVTHDRESAHSCSMDNLSMGTVSMGTTSSLRARPRFTGTPYSLGTSPLYGRESRSTGPSTLKFALAQRRLCCPCPSVFTGDWHCLPCTSTPPNKRAAGQPPSGYPFSALDACSSTHTLCEVHHVLCPGLHLDAPVHWHVDSKSQPTRASRSADTLLCLCALKDVHTHSMHQAKLDLE